jgi:hypothetical protein
MADARARSLQMDPAKAAVFAEEIAAALAMKPEPKPKRKAGGTLHQ